MYFVSGSFIHLKSRDRIRTLLDANDRDSAQLKGKRDIDWKKLGYLKTRGKSCNWTEANGSSWNLGTNWTRNEGLEDTSCDSQLHVGLWQTGFLKGRKHKGSRVSRAQVLPLGTDPAGQSDCSDSSQSTGSGCFARRGPEGFAYTALTRLMILWTLCSGGGYYIYFTDEMEKEIAAHSSVLGWKSPWTEEPGRLQIMGSQESVMTEHTQMSKLRHGEVRKLDWSHKA